MGRVCRVLAAKSCKSGTTARSGGPASVSACFLRGYVLGFRARGMKGMIKCEGPGTVLQAIVNHNR